MPISRRIVGPVPFVNYSPAGDSAPLRLSALTAARLPAVEGLAKLSLLDDIRLSRYFETQSGCLDNWLLYMLRILHDLQPLQG